MKKKLKIAGWIMLGISAVLLVLIVSTVIFMSKYPAFGRVPGRAERAKYEKKTPLFQKGKFRNANPTRVMTGKSGSASSRVRPEQILPAVRRDKIERAEEGKLIFTWFGHSSTLFQMGEKNIFLDPVLSERTSPVSFAGPKRFSEIAISPENLPDLDVVFISHDHFDHLDYATIQAIKDRTDCFITPLGIDACLKGWGVSEEKLKPLAWWESVAIGGITYTLVPSQHFSGRNPLKMNRTLWGGIHFTDGIHSVYYSGDSGYCDVFAEVYRRLGEPDVMMADSGQYDSGWADIHMNANQSVQAAKDAHARRFVPVHWGAFVLARHAWDEPPETAIQAAEKLDVQLATPRIGEEVDYDKIDQFTEQWWKEYR